MHTLKIFLPVFALFLFFSAAQAQKPSGMVKKTAKAVAPVAETATFKVLGNCGMCQKTIQGAAATAGASKADWDKETTMITVVFDPARTSVDAIQKSIAQAGYDNDGYKGVEEAYNNLHACCQYDRTGAPSTAKECEEPINKH